MDTLRRSRRTASLLLAWFFAFLAVAGAAPLMQDKPMHELCTVDGIVQVAVQDDAGDADRHAAHPLECALCAAISGPPATVAVLPAADAPLAHALLPIVSAQLASLTAAPLPARGPPHFS